VRYLVVFRISGQLCRVLNQLLECFLLANEVEEFLIGLLALLFAEIVFGDQLLQRESLLLQNLVDFT